MNSSGTQRGTTTGTTGFSDVQGNIAPTGSYAHTELAGGQPKGTNISEDPDLKGKSEFGPIGTKKDPARVAELEFAKRDAAVSGGGARDLAQGGDSKFAGLKDEKA